MARRSRWTRMKVALALVVLSGAAHAERWIDTPAWPAKLPTTAVVRWVVHPYQGGGDGVLPKRPTSLEVVVDNVTRKLELSPQDGELKKDYLPLCASAGGANAFPLKRGEVGEITFDNAGDGGFIIKRSGDVLEINRWQLSDGACPGPHGEPGACPRQDKSVAKLHVPAALKLREELVEVDDHGARTALDCSKLR